MKRTLSILLCVILMLSVMIIPANAEDADVMYDALNLPEELQVHLNVLHAQTAPVIDGVINEGEYTAGYDLAFLLTPAEMADPCQGYFSVDDDYIYFAFDIHRDGGTDGTTTTTKGKMVLTITFPKTSQLIDLRSRLSITMLETAAQSGKVNFTGSTLMQLGVSTPLDIESDYADLVKAVALTHKDNHAYWEIAISRAALTRAYQENASYASNSAYDLTTGSLDQILFYPTITRANGNIHKGFHLVSQNTTIVKRFDGIVSMTNSEGKTCGIISETYANDVYIGRVVLNFDQMYVQTKANAEDSAKMDARVLLPVEANVINYASAGMLFSTDKAKLAIGADKKVAMVSGVVDSGAITKVYGSVLAGGEPVTAESKGGAYFLGAVVTGIAAGNFETPVYVRPYFVDANGVVSYGEIASFTVSAS